MRPRIEIRRYQLAPEPEPSDPLNYDRTRWSHDVVVEYSRWKEPLDGRNTSMCYASSHFPGMRFRSLRTANVARKELEEYWLMPHRLVVNGKVVFRR